RRPVTAEAIDPGRGPRQLIPGESRRMNLNNDIAVVRAREAGERRPLRLWPLYQLHPGRSRGLIRCYNCLHRASPSLSVWARKLKRFRCETGSFVARNHRLSRATKLDNELPHSKILVHKQPDVTQRSDLSVPVVEMIVCRYGNPGAVAARIVIGVTAPALLAVGKAGVKARMDDREITQQADSHVLGHKPADRHRLRHQLEILALLEQRAVGSRAHEVVGENLPETLHIPLLH